MPNVISVKKTMVAINDTAKSIRSNDAVALDEEVVDFRHSWMSDDFRSKRIVKITRSIHGIKRRINIRVMYSLSDLSFTDRLHPVSLIPFKDVILTGSYVMSSNVSIWAHKLMTNTQTLKRIPFLIVQNRFAFNGNETTKNLSIDRPTVRLNDIR